MRRKLLNELLAEVWSRQTPQLSWRHWYPGTELVRCDRRCLETRCVRWFGNDVLLTELLRILMLGSTSEASRAERYGTVELRREELVSR